MAVPHGQERVPDRPAAAGRRAGARAVARRDDVGRATVRSGPSTRSIRAGARKMPPSTRGCATRLGRALQALPPPYRLVVFLREVEGLSTREVATVVGISEANVKTRLHRARLMLRAGAWTHMRRSPSPECRAFLERLSRYVDEELPPRTSGRPHGTSAHCPCCHEMVESLERTVALCRVAGRRRLPPRRGRAPGKDRAGCSPNPDGTPARALTPLYARRPWRWPGPSCQSTGHRPRHRCPTRSASSGAPACSWRARTPAGSGLLSRLMLPRICSSDSYSCSSIHAAMPSRIALRCSGPCLQQAETIWTALAPAMTALMASAAGVHAAGRGQRRP